jgi:hypothetical protein
MGSPNLPVGADTDLLPGPAFVPYEKHMDETEARLNEMGEPETVHPRSPIDKVANEVLPPAYHAAKDITRGLRMLPQGDAQQVQDLAKFFQKAEEANTEDAKKAFG